MTITISFIFSLLLPVPIIITPSLAHRLAQHYNSISYQCRVCLIGDRNSKDGCKFRLGRHWSNVENDGWAGVGPTLSPTVGIGPTLVGQPFGNEQK